MRKFLLSLVALIGLCSAAALGNYAMTQGAGTTFGSVTVGGIHYVQMFLCDLTTPAQCGSVSAGGALKVDASATTQPVSGTVAATQSGTWTVQPGNTANTTPWLITGSGTAGAAAAGVQTVQGIASMTPLFIQSGTVPVSTMNSASANTGINAANAAVFDDTSPTAITENNFGFLRMSANRNLYGTIRDAAGNERGVNVDASNRLTTAPTMVSGSVASGAYASGSIASGAFASGAVASGAYASGAFATGSMVDLLTFQGTKNAGTAAANSFLTGGVFNSTPLTLTNTQQSSLQLDANGYLKVNTAAGAAAGGTSSNFGSAFPTPGTAVGMSDGTNMVAMRSTAYGTTPTGLNALAVNAFVTNTNANGSAVSASSSPVVIASDQAAVAVKGNAANGAAVSGNPNLIAGSDGTNARTLATDTAGNQKVISGASGYETVAASQTAQVLGPTGATGDYLSHCVIYPVTTSPGVVTVFDNTNAAGTNAIAFAGGSSSTSNLVPISVPVGAVSTAGAWKVTTGANVIVTCYGKFT